MKKTLFSLLVLCLASLAASAQEPDTLDINRYELEEIHDDADSSLMLVRRVYLQTK